MKQFFYQLLLIGILALGFNASFAQETRGVIVQKNNKADSAAGNTYAIIVGISDYPYLQPLQFADKDAELFRDFLLSPAGGNVKPENMHVLLNENATSANFWVKGFAWLRNKKLQKGDRLYFYFAGHGDAIDKDQYFFLPYDCSPGGDKNNYLATGAIQIYNLKINIEKLSNSGVDVLLIMDACRSNELPGGAEGQKILGEAIAEKRSGETMMLAAGSGQESLEDRTIGNGHGLFTWYLVDGLAGNADADKDNGNQDGKVDLEEIESWAKRNVKKVAQQKFHHVQVPYFCCTGTPKTIAKVDSLFFKRWVAATKLNADVGQDLFALNKQTTQRGTSITEPDSNVIKLYNQFSRSVKENKLVGDSSAEYWYNKMTAQFPKHSYTQEAKYSFTSELINFAQEKINLYLNGSDYKFRVSKDSSRKQFLFEQKLNAVANTPFYKVANMLEKGIKLSRQFDTTIEKKYLSKLYFLKARGELDDAESWTEPRIKDMDEIKEIWGNKPNTAFRTYMKEPMGYAFKALEIDPNAAYIYHLLAKYQFCKDWEVFYDPSGTEMVNPSLADPLLADSVVYYEKKATTLAPNWYYAYYHWGNFYTKPASSYHFDSSLYGNYKNDQLVDSAGKLFKKCLEINPLYLPAYLGLANVLNRKDDLNGAIALLKKAELIYPSNYNIDNELIKYYFKLNIDSGKYYYRKFTDTAKNRIFYSALNQLSRYFINNDNLPMTVFICKEQLQLSNPWWTACNMSPRYALTKNNTRLFDTLYKLNAASPDTFVKSRMFYELATEYDERNDLAKAIDYSEKSIQNDRDWFMIKYELAGRYSLVKNKSKALYYLERSFKKGYVQFSDIQKNTRLDFIRNTVEFKALMKKYFPNDVK